MRDFRDAKTMAQSLRKALAARETTVTHSQSLELIAQAFGLADWNTLSAAIDAEKRAPLEAAPHGKKTLYCSFCEKSQHDVETLIAGPDVMICSECVGLCDGILVDGRLGKAIAEARSGSPDEEADAGADVVRRYSDEHLAAVRKSNADWLEHLAWSLGKVAARLDHDTPWLPDETAQKRGWTRDPLAGLSHDEIVARRTEFETRQRGVRERLEIIDRILAERAPA